MTTATAFHYDASLFPGGEDHSAHFKVESAVGYDKSTVQGPTSLTGGTGVSSYTSCIRVRQPDKGDFALVFWLEQQGAKFDKCESSEDGSTWTEVSRGSSNGRYRWKFTISSATKPDDLKDYFVRFSSGTFAGSTITISVRPRSKLHPVWDLLDPVIPA